AVRCNEKDRRLLLLFKQGVIDPANRLFSWTSEEEDCCSWIGVQCDNITGRVTELDLAGQLLQGDINLCLVLQLEFLNYLDLHHNEFVTVSIPPCQPSRSSSDDQSANLSAALRYLDFSSNYDLPINDLRWLSGLSSLNYLDLNDCDIENETKWLEFVAMLPSLSELHLRSCGLRDFPRISYVNFTSLSTLDLSFNLLNSELPYSLFNLTNDISVLDLSHNGFYGKVPMSLFKLPKLKQLSLSFNSIKGSIPDLIGQHEQLQHLFLRENSFNGSIPPSLGIFGVLSEKNFANLSNLTSLYLSSSGFKFHIDPNWVPPFQLEYFELRNTSLGPTIPAWLYTQRSLRWLDISGSGISTIDDTDMFWSFVARIDSVNLSYNLMSGDMSPLTLNSTFINLEYNSFTGGLPHISSNVVNFWASHNSFSGSIFPLLCHSKIISREKYSLATLDLSYNHLGGTLPNCWAKYWEQLIYLDLGSNKLTGEVPPSIASLNFLAYLDLSRILPTLPQNLVVIKLRANQFTGNIPTHLCNLSSLAILDLADNTLSGSIPSCLNNIMHPINASLWLKVIKLSAKGRELDYKDVELLRLIDLSANNFSGEIPKELFSLIQMWSLNLSRNHLRGKIPREIGGMKNLESFDLSCNKLSGEIPPAISNLSFLDYLNLSYNNFVGQIPLGTQIQSFDSWSFVGNLGLCGDPLPKRCNKKEETNNSNQAEVNEDDFFLSHCTSGWELDLQRASGEFVVLSFSSGHGDTNFSDGLIV
ncbi:receptor-like protein EIX2, partial [Prosopis cineraria]|uniref:receptor-like protein EIX2 n=1 Tax=Prosopis cineraria TaxID=364024 RepID=UPI00240FC889